MLTQYIILSHTKVTITKNSARGVDTFFNTKGKKKKHNCLSNKQKKLNISNILQLSLIKNGATRKFLFPLNTQNTRTSSNIANFYKIL